MTAGFCDNCAATLDTSASFRYIRTQHAHICSLMVNNKADVLKPVEIRGDAAYVSAGIEKLEKTRRVAAEKAAKKHAREAAKAEKKGLSPPPEPLEIRELRESESGSVSIPHEACSTSAGGSVVAFQGCRHSAPPGVYKEINEARQHLWCGVDPASDRSSAVPGFNPPTGKATKTTLVVCPVVAVLQWAAEIEKHTKAGALSVCVYVGTPAQRKAMAADFHKYDVVLTSYSVVEAEFRKMVATTKVKCKYCSKMFFPEKLEIHWRYFCGPNAHRTAAQSLTERSGAAGGSSSASAAASASGGTKGKKRGTGGTKSNVAVPTAAQGELVVVVDDSPASGDDVASPPPTKRARGKGGKGKGRKVAKAPAGSESGSDEDGPVVPRRRGSPSGRGRRKAAASKPRSGQRRQAASGAGAGRGSESSDGSDDEAVSIGAAARAAMSRAVAKTKQRAAAGSKVATSQNRGAARGGGVKRTRAGEAVSDDDSANSDSDAASDSDTSEAEGVIGRSVLGPRSVLQQVAWRRVILDEAHYIKNRRSGTAKAIFNLTAERRWCLSGTPLQNRVGELYSQIRFLRVFPYAYYFATTCGCKSLDYQFGGNYKNCGFCGESPMRHFCWWNRHVQNPILRDGYSGAGADAMKLLRTKVLKNLLLRRTKQGRSADLTLPPRLITFRCAPLDAFEADFYEALYTSSVSKFDTYVEKGVVLHNYASIFDLLMRLRQAVDHPYLVLYSASAAMAAARAAAGLDSGDALPPTASANVADVCALCGEAAERPVASACGHVFCTECVRELLDAVPDGADDGTTPAPNCPACFAALSVVLDSDTPAASPVSGTGKAATTGLPSADGGSSETESETASTDYDSDASGVELAAPAGKRQTRAATDVAGTAPLPSLAPLAVAPLTKVSRATILSRIPADRIGRGFRSSTKLEALLQCIHADRTADPGSKCIIFSQFVSFLDLIQHRLALAGIRAVRLDGRMSAKARGRVITAFKSDPGITAFCISLKAGGVALNLTEANRAYILDSWWNPAAELQAMDRTHRVGQHRSIQVVRFVVPGTIEEKVVALQEKKRLVFQATVGQDNKSLAKLTEQDMRYLFSR